MKKLLMPSMMCADYSNLKEEVLRLEEADIDMFHCDVMDGTAVPNFAMGLVDIVTIRKHTDKIIDVHLMIENPSQKIDLFIDAGVDLIYIHPEMEKKVIETLQFIKSKGVLAGLAISPDTTIASVRHMLDFADYVMVMTVHPGFAGQKYLDFTTRKIEQLVKLKKSMNFKLVIDGAMSPEKIQQLSRLGADGFVLGTSALFGKDKNYQELIDDLRKL